VKESSGEASSGKAACQVTWRVSGIRSSRVAARVGRCNDWQTWQTVSGPLLCSCRKTPPAAKYNIARQARTASARRAAFGPKLLLNGCTNLGLSSETYTAIQMYHVGRAKTQLVAYPRNVNSQRSWVSTADLRLPWLDLKCCSHLTWARCALREHSCLYSWERRSPFTCSTALA
jgi:hypothetical protein